MIKVLSAHSVHSESKSKRMLAIYIRRMRYNNLEIRIANSGYIAVDSVFSRALIGFSNSACPVLFTSDRRQTRISYEKNGFPGCCLNKRRNVTNSRRSCYRKTRRGRRNSVWKFLQVKLFLFNLNLSMKPVKTFFVFQMQIKSWVTLFS